MPKRGTKLIKIPLLIFFLLVSCARLKQCAYEGLNRDQWQQPDRVVESLQIHPGDQVADIGSGSGYFVFSLAKAARKSGIANVEVILAKTDDPSLPRTGVDLIFTSNTYHHIDNRVTYLTNLRKYLRPSGRVAVIDFDRRAWLEGMWKHYTPSEFIKREMDQAGYNLQHEFDFLDRQSFLIFAPKPQALEPSKAPPSADISGSE